MASRIEVLCALVMTKALTEVLTRRQNPVCDLAIRSENGFLLTQASPTVHRVPLSIETTSRVAVPAQARPSPRRTVHQTPRRTTPKPVNTYMQPNPWPPDLVLEHASYKAADDSHGAASSRYRRERKRREAEVKARTWTSGRKTFAPGYLTPDSHFELRPMAVDWEDKAQTFVLADCNLPLGLRTC